MLERIAHHARNRDGKVMMAWIIFVSVVLVVGAVANNFIKSALIGSLITAVLSTLVFQIMVTLQLGYVDKFSLIAVIVTFPVGLILAGVEIAILRKGVGKKN